jgi:hypothetical protein
MVFISKGKNSKSGAAGKGGLHLIPGETKSLRFAGQNQPSVFASTFIGFRRDGEARDGIKLEFPAKIAVDDCRSMQTKPKPKWQRALTLQRLEIIRRNLDKTDAEIGRMLGIGRTAVHFQRQRYKITKVHGTIQRVQRIAEQMRRLKPGLSAKAAALQLGISVVMAYKYGKLTGYQFLGRTAARHFYWRKRIKSLPPLLTLSAVARELGVTYGHAALLCFRHKYKATIRNGWRPARVPIRRWVQRPRHERWLASLKPAKP